ncbi:MAG: BREX system ATP-binding domain-containing protein, partial [Aminobacteriaceae bacterium]
FLAHCSKKIGEAYFRTPRTTIKAFADFLAVLEQNPEIQWTSLIDEIPVEEDRPTDMPEIADEGEEEAPEDGLSSFRI